MQENGNGESIISDPKIINCFKQGIIGSFASIYGKEPNLHENSEHMETPHDAVVGIISVAGKDIAYSLMIGFPRESGSFLASKFVGFNIDFDSTDMKDAIGELANIIAGDIAARLNSIGIKANLSLPTVAHGKSIEILKIKNLNYVKHHFSIHDGKFWTYIVAGFIANLLNEGA